MRTHFYLDVSTHKRFYHHKFVEELSMWLRCSENNEK